MSCETSHGHASVTQLCATFDLSRQAYYVARRETPITDTPDRTKEAASQVRSHASRSGSQRATRIARTSGAERRCVPTDELLAAIREVVRENPAWGVRKVWATLRRRELRASRKRIWAIMHANGLTLEPVAHREFTARGHVTVPDSNRRWGTDLTTTSTKRDGVVAIMPTIDFGDRFGLSITVSKSQEAPPVLAGFGDALHREFGSPSNVPDGFEARTDHGPQYTGSDCSTLFATWNVNHTFAPIGRPTGNAVTERFIETMKIELIWTHDWESADELRAALAAWLVKYNHERPHQSLGWLTPAEKRALNLGRPLVAAA